MGMNINKSGRNYESRSVNFVLTLFGNLADGDYAAFADRHVSNPTRNPSTVNYRSVANN